MGIEMKKFLLGTVVAVGLSTSVLAADLPVYNAPPASAPVAVYDWTGVYLGLQAGYLWGESEWLFIGVEGDYAPFDPDGAFAGIYAGYNYQFANGVVLGVDADINYSWADGGSVYFDGSTGDPYDPDDRAEAEINWHGALRARLGYAFDRFLPYIAGGLAVADYEWHRFTPKTPWSDSDTFFGYTVGAGLEYAFTDNLVARAEYRFSDYDDWNSSPADYGIDLQTHDVRVGGSILFASDRRLKRDIMHIATLETGIKLYRFKYFWDDQVHVGVMAQDLLGDEAFQHAVVMTQNGYYAVNYETLGLKMATLEAWRDYGLAAVLLQSPGSRVSSLVENVLR